MLPVFNGNFQRNDMEVVTPLRRLRSAEALRQMASPCFQRRLCQPCALRQLGSQRPPRAFTNSTLASSRRRAMSMAVRSLVKAALCAVTTSKYPTAPP